MGSLSKILERKLVSIIRGWDTPDLLDMVEALYTGGIRLVEVTLNSPNALKSIEQLNTVFGDKMAIGVGTVLNAKSANEAINAGASFVISPTFDIKTIKMTKQMGAISIPGAFSPTEIYQAHSEGADIVKVFPSILGPEYIKNVLGPLDEVRLMPTGGVNVGNISAYLNAGAVAFGIGGGLLQSNNTGSERLKDIEQNAKKYVEALSLES